MLAAVLDRGDQQVFTIALVPHDAALGLAVRLDGGDDGELFGLVEQFFGLVVEHQVFRNRLISVSNLARFCASLTPRPSSGASASTPTLPWC